MDTPQLGQNEKVTECLRLYQQLQGERFNWEGHWQEIAQRIWPSESNSFSSLAYQNKNGQKLNQFVFDSTAAEALKKFGAIIDSLLTPRNQTWHHLKPTDSALLKERDVRIWFEEVNKALFNYRYAPKANFSAQNQRIFKGLGAFGTGCLYIDELAGHGLNGLRYRSVHLGELFIRENHQGQVDTVIRYFPMRIRQMLQKWGNMVPETLRERAKSNPNEQVPVIHCVEPNASRDPGRSDYRGMAFSSYYVSVEGQALLEEKGYRAFPYTVPRYDQTSNEVWGRSPAMDVLPAIKTLNEEKKTMLKQGQRTVDPILLASDDGVVDGFSMRPGAINPGGVNAEGRPLVHALPVGNISIGKELMDDERAVIKDAFLVNLFQILVETPTMTATEVMERTREKGILLAPTVGGLESEYLGPMIEREIDVLVQQRLIPPMPFILQRVGAEYRVQYDSPLTRAQRAEEASGLMRTVELALKIASEGGNPETLDFFDWDEIIPAVADIQGVPTKWLKDPKMIAAMRAQRQQQQQVQQATASAPGAAALMKAAAVSRAANQEFPSLAAPDSRRAG